MIGCTTQPMASIPHFLQAVTGIALIMYINTGKIDRKWF